MILLNKKIREKDGWYSLSDIVKAIDSRFSASGLASKLKDKHKKKIQFDKRIIWGVDRLALLWVLNYTGDCSVMQDLIDEELIQVKYKKAIQTLNGYKEQLRLYPGENAEYLMQLYDKRIAEAEKFVQYVKEKEQQCAALTDDTELKAYLEQATGVVSTEVIGETINIVGRDTKTKIKTINI